MTSVSVSIDRISVTFLTYCLYQTLPLWLPLFGVKINVQFKRYSIKQIVHLEGFLYISYFGNSNCCRFGSVLVLE